MKKVLLTIVMSVLACMYLSAQQRTVSGRVTDETGQPLPQVSVLLKGTTTGIPTDLDGNYRLTVPETGGTLIFRFLGYVTQEVEIGNQTTISIQLQPDVTEIEEFVVTAQGIARDKKALGYSIGQVEKDLIQTRPETDVSRILRGKVPGVDITAVGGFLGRQTDIRIRSQSSVNGDNTPLFIVDGVFYDSDRFLDIDPNNIEDVNILKGLAASSLYGQEGRNGVIIITTKTGSVNKAARDFSLTVNQQVFMNQISNLPDFQNTYGQGADNFPNVTFIGNWGGRFADGYTVPGHYATGAVPGYDVIFPELQGNVPYQAFPNNVNDFFNNNFGSNTSIVANARVGKTSLGFSTGYNDETGYIDENSITKLNFSSSVNTELVDGLNLNTTFQYSETETRRPTFNVFDRLLYLPRNFDLFGLPFENPNDLSSVFYRADLENPLWQLKNTSVKSTRKGFFGKIGLTYNLNDKFSVGYRVGIDSYNTVSVSKRNKGGLGATTGLGSLQTTNSQRLNLDHNFLFAGQGLKLSPKIELNTQLGLNLRSLNSESFGISSSDQVVYGFFRHGNFRTHEPTGNTNRRTNVIGLYGQAEFGYEDYLYLTLSGRNDWGSQVEKANRSLFYPSASVSFIPTNVFETIKSNNLNYLKVRFGYGTSAGFPGPFQTRATLNANANRFVTNDGVIIATNGISSFLPNPDLKPERLTEYEFGINSKLFNFKADVDLSIYKRISEDQVLSRSLPSSGGFTSTVINAGRIDTKGLELGVTVYPIQTSNFEWRIINNFTAYETTAIDLPEEFINYANGLNFAIEGEPLGVFRLNYVVRDEDGNALINPEDGTIITSGEAGLVNKVVGDPNPDFQYTIINGFSYKNLKLNVQVEYTRGGDIYSSTASNILRRGVTKDTEDREGTYIIPGYYGNPATGEPLLDENGNKIRNTIQLGANDLYFLNTIDVNENLVFDGTLLRIREVNLSYDLPNKWLTQLPFESVGFSFNVQNLWYKAFNFPEHMNFDPEVSSGSANGRGFDTQSDPSMRKFSLGVRLTF